MKTFNYEECMKEHDGKAVTRDGRTVRLLCNDFTGVPKKPVVGLVKNLANGSESILTFDQTGRHQVHNSIDSGADLFTPSKRIQREFWLNIYSKNLISIHYSSKKEADFSCDSTTRIACIKVTIDCEEGEGLS